MRLCECPLSLTSAPAEPLFIFQDRGVNFLAPCVTDKRGRAVAAAKVTRRRAGQHVAR